MTPSVAEVVIGKLQAFMASKGIAPPSLTGNERLGELEVDSLKIIELIFELESMYSIEVAEHQLQDLKTINDLISVVEEARSSTSPA